MIGSGVTIKLNPAQQTAVDAIDGPVLVIAGPGTGKTQLLSMRVVKILETTDTSPQNILCLTFTNKAANNMRERLFDLIGPTAYSVAVHTFHSFAADIMNKNPDHFWNGASLSVVPDAVQLEIIQDILGSLPLDNPLARRFAGELTGLKATKEALKLTKEAGLTPEKLRAIIELNLAYIDIAEPILVEHLSAPLSFKKLQTLADSLEADLPEQSIDEHMAPLMSLRTVILKSLDDAINQDEPTGKSTNTGKWKKRFIQTVAGQKLMDDERRRNNWWLALSDVYTKYRDSLHERGYYDYADMLVEVIVQLEKNDELRASVQEQYNYVLIDEFQDTNSAQLRLAHLVADHYSSAGKPNLMVVGDDDQSIYKFNGAELNNMLGFRSFYGVDKPIVLSENYRSSQAILDVAKLVAEQSTDRLVNREKDITKNLVATRDATKGSVIEHIHYPSEQHQFSSIARKIDDTFSPEKTVAVLARNHQSLRNMASRLQALNVPVRYEQQNDVLAHPAVEQVIILAQAMVAIAEGDEPEVNTLLAHTLRHPMWGIDAKILWQLAIDNRYNAHWLDSMLTSDDEKLKSIAGSMIVFAQTAVSEPLPLVLEQLLGLRDHESFHSPLKDYYVQNAQLSQQYLETLSALQLLRSMADEFSRHSTAKLTDFVNFIKVNQGGDSLVSDQTVFLSGQHAVELLTVHKAKGLEFDTVYIIDAVESNWKPSTNGRKPPANLPLQAYGDDQDDYVRLFYVAVTRAKQSLIVSSYATDTSGKDILPAAFVRASLPERIANEEIETLTILEESSTWPQLSNVDEKLLLTPLVEDFRLPVTAMINFLDVDAGGPQYFKERNLLRLPEAKSISQSYGTAIHSALEYAMILTNRGKFDLDDITTKFEDALIKEHVPAHEFERYHTQGQRLLWTLFETNRYELPQGSLSEQSLNYILPGGAQLGGKLDRVDTQDKSNLVIVDYKTGNGLSSFSTQNKNLMVKAWKHKTQLIFYALLTSLDPRYSGFKSTECQMVYVECPEIKDLIRSYFPSPDEVARMATLASKVYAHIQNLNFPDISGYPEGIDGILQFEQDLIDDKI
ncbi:ATP-dependent helicase [Candidatus Saccharibacteria bacterium]|jgi:DNA helicase-2/ATP-dependent DNA helicase PcrA|nr:ATP-dependent helicase [Candidatus Saccharibacteria bacterium]